MEAGIKNQDTNTAERKRNKLRRQVVNADAPDNLKWKLDGFIDGER